MTVVVCVASGPSLTAEQVEIITAAHDAGRCRVVVVNNSFERFPRADVLYAADTRWWRHYWPRVSAEFQGECWTCSPEAAREFGLCQIKVDSRRRGLSREPGVLASGNNGGYQLIGLAHQFGASRILLVGYDMQHTGGRAHHHADHPSPMSNAAGVAQWAPAFVQLHADLLAAGVPLVNCSLQTALTIPRGDLQTELERECSPA